MEMKKQLIVGLPGTGKTTFLAALWQVVESEEVPGSLLVSEVHGIRDHLNRIRQKWLCYQELERTRIPSERVVSFRLRDPQSNNLVELSLPDLSGETFRLQWETRQWTTEFERLASDTTGALVFLHPRTIIEPVRIDSVVEALATALEEGGQSAELPPMAPEGTALNSAEDANAKPTVEPWSPVHTPTQVKLVEILQFLRSGPFVNRTLPIAVIVSAWDLVTTGETPSQWVGKRLPLLDQFLRANVEAIPFTVFGVSAQGADLSKADELQNHVRASDRIIVTPSDLSTTHDITAPLKWLLER